MAEILLSKQQLSNDDLIATYGISMDSLANANNNNPATISAYMPYLVTQGAIPGDRNILNQLASPSVARALTDFSFTFGASNTIALSQITKKLVDYNISAMGASTSVYANRIEGFAGAVQEYQEALLHFRDVHKVGGAQKHLAKQRAVSAFGKMQKQFRNELNAVNGVIKNKRRGTPMTRAERGLNIARSSRRATKLYVADQIQASNLVKFTKHAKILGNGLAVIDFGSRVGKIHNTYQEGGNWERDMFVESSSFALSATAGVLTVKAGTAALSFLAIATPVGWIGLVVGGVVVAGAAAAASMKVNSMTKSNSGSWYDSIMSLLEIK